MAAYWFCVCPKCHGNGRLVIRKKEEDGHLFFNCDECESSWNDPGDIGNFDRVFLGFKISSTKATEDEIKSYGWINYAKKIYES